MPKKAGFHAKIPKKRQFLNRSWNHLPGALIPKSPQSIPRLFVGYFGNVMILCNFRSGHFFAFSLKVPRKSLWLMIFTLCQSEPTNRKRLGKGKGKNLKIANFKETSERKLIYIFNFLFVFSLFLEKLRNFGFFRNVNIWTCQFGNAIFTRKENFWQILVR